MTADEYDEHVELMEREDDQYSDWMHDQLMKHAPEDMAKCDKLIELGEYPSIQYNEISSRLDEVQKKIEMGILS